MQTFAVRNGLAALVVSTWSAGAVIEPAKADDRAGQLQLAQAESPRSSRAIAQTSGVCNYDAFHAQFSWSAAWDILAKIKIKTGYIPNAREQEQIMRAERSRQRLLIERALHALSEKVPTAALIYGSKESQPCVWLVSGAGILAGAELAKFDAWQFHQLWTGLDVISRAGKRAPCQGQPALRARQPTALSASRHRMTSWRALIMR
jgi:hypothetical protein